MRPPRLPEQENAIFKGDLVLVQSKRRRKGIHQKLLPKFNRPFIVKVFDNGTFKVAGQGTINECRLKLFTLASDPAGQLRAQGPARMLTSQGMIFPVIWKSISGLKKIQRQQMLHSISMLMTSTCPGRNKFCLLNGQGVP